MPGCVDVGDISATQTRATRKLLGIDSAAGELVETRQFIRVEARTTQFFLIQAAQTGYCDNPAGITSFGTHLDNPAKNIAACLGT